MRNCQLHDNMHRQLITHLLDAENDLLFVLLRHFKADDTPIAHIESDYLRIFQHVLDCRPDAEEAARQHQMLLHAAAVSAVLHLALSRSVHAAATSAREVSLPFLLGDGHLVASQLMILAEDVALRLFTHARTHTRAQRA